MINDRPASPHCFTNNQFFYRSKKISNFRGNALMIFMSQQRSKGWIFSALSSLGLLTRWDLSQELSWLDDLCLILNDEPFKFSCLSYPWEWSQEAETIGLGLLEWSSKACVTETERSISQKCHENSAADSFCSQNAWIHFFFKRLCMISLFWLISIFKLLF